MGTFNRFNSARMADNKGKGILLEDDDEPIQLVAEDDPHTIREYRMSLIGKVLNPKKQNVEKLINHMPTQWGVQDRITANDLGNGKFLFNFSSEEDIQSVLQQGPFHYNFCMFVLVRWEPIVHDDYPWIIPFWVEISGIPLHLWTVKNLRKIGGKLGHIDTMELSEGRLLVDVDTRKPLIFTKKVSSPEGDEVSIHFTYEKLFKHCKYCGFLSHEEPLCSKKHEDQRVKTKESDVFSRVQLPQESQSRQPLLWDAHGRDRYHDRYGRTVSSRQELRSTNYENALNAYNARAEFEAPSRGHGNERYDHRLDRNRWSRSSSRQSYRYAPYEHKKSFTWREKNKYLETDGAERESRTQSFLPSSSHNDQKMLIRKVRSSGKRLASTIITPSRDNSTKDDNVTFRKKDIARAIDFSPTAKVLSNDQEDGQIIGALQDMDIEDAAIIVAPHEDAWMDCEVQCDDLLGEELKALEDASSSRHANKEKTESIKRLKVKKSTSSKGISRSRVPLGLPIKKAEFLRRGSPRKRHAVMIGLPPSGETEEYDHPRISSSKKSRASPRNGNGSEGSTTTSRLHP